MKRTDTPFSNLDGSGSGIDVAPQGRKDADGNGNVRIRPGAAKLNDINRAIRQHRHLLETTPPDNRGPVSNQIAALIAQAAEVRAEIVADRKKRTHAGRMRSLSIHTASRVLVFGEADEKKLATAAELKTLRDLQARCDALATQLAKFDYGAPRAAYKKVHAAYAADPTPENLAAVVAAVGVSQDEAREQIRRGKKPIREALAALCAKSAPIVWAIQQRAADFLEAESERLAAEEAKTAARYGVPHEHGPLHGAIYNLVRQLRHPLMLSINNLGPRANLAGIIKL